MTKTATVAPFGCALLGGLGRPASPPAPAELLFLHGAVQTMDAARSWAAAVAVRDGRIVYVGTDAGTAEFRGARTRVVDLAGRMLLPGFHDSHVHPVTSGIDLSQCELSPLTTREEVFAEIRRYAAAHPKEEWIIGSGWALPLFPGANPTRQELDLFEISSEEIHRAKVLWTLLEGQEVYREASYIP